MRLTQHNKLKKPNKTKINKIKNNKISKRNYKKSNKLNHLVKNITQSGGGVDSATAYFIANYNEKTKDFVISDVRLKEYISSNLAKIIELKQKQIEELKKEFSEEEKSILDQIQTVSSKKLEESKKTEIVKKKGGVLTKLESTLQEKLTALQHVIEKLEHGHPAGIYEDAELLFEIIISYFQSFETNTKCVINGNIDMFVKFYLNGSMGNPNSIENFGRLVDGMNDFELLKANAKSLGDIDKTIDSFTGLTGDTDDYLEHFLNKQKYYVFLEEHDQQKHEDMFAISEADKLIDISNEEGSIVVYWLKTEAAAKYYGRGTKWCTAAKSNNQFKHYNKYGKIYMIQIDEKGKKTHNEKGKKSHKYQIHVESDQFMNERDEPVDIDTFLKYIEPIDKNKLFFIWIVKTYFCILSDNGETITIKKINSYVIDYIKTLPNINELIYDVKNKIIKALFHELFDNLKEKIKSLTFTENFFNAEFFSKIEDLKQLESLTVPNNFDIDHILYNDDIMSLPKLKYITLNHYHHDTDKIEAKYPHIEFYWTQYK
jgi:hypothetical protein